MGEGLLRLRLYMVTALMLIIVGGMFLVRELVFNVDLNVYDSDWRDQLYGPPTAGLGCPGRLPPSPSPFSHAGQACS